MGPTIVFSVVMIDMQRLDRAISTDKTLSRINSGHSQWRFRVLMKSILGQPTEDASCVTGLAFQQDKEGVTFRAKLKQAI